MKKLLICLLLLAPCLALASAPPRAPNYVLVYAKDINQVKPLTTVESGRFDVLRLDDSDPGRVQPPDTEGDDAIGLNGVKVYAYLNGRLIGTTKIDKYEAGQQDEWNDNVHLVSPEQLSNPAQIFTTRPLPYAARAQQRQPTASEMTGARELIRGVLDHHGVPESAKKNALETMEVRPINVRSGEPEILLMTWGAELGEKALGFFLIGERSGSSYRLAGGKFHWGGLVCGQTHWTFLGNADLDGDGTDELMYEAWGWESVSYWLLKRERGEWKPAGAVASDGDSPNC